MEKFYAIKKRPPIVPCFVLSLLCSPFLHAQHHKNKEAKNSTATAERSYYAEAGSYGTLRESDPPSYTRNIGDLRSARKKNDDWLNVGLDSRMRIELRYDDIRRLEAHNSDYPLLFRQRAYIGLVRVLDPFRVAVEAEDSRRSNSPYPLNNRDVNTVELIQAYAELYFKKGLGKDKLGNDRPIDIRFGRMAFEFLDRRLVARNEWRNTTNNFTGLRLSLGQDKNDWQIDALLVKPINRNIDRFDLTDHHRLFASLIGHWRKWSNILTIEPHYMRLRQTAAPSNANVGRDIHSLGLRLYGKIKETGLNYDLTGIYQFGNDNGMTQEAYSFVTDIGYAFKKSSYHPRASIFFGYASGDKNPSDQISNRFERYFGFSRPWSANDYMVMENIVATKARIEVEKRIRKLLLKIDADYSFYWVASASDRFVNLANENYSYRDVDGKSGRFLGHSFYIRARIKPFYFLALNVGYVGYASGEFIKNQRLNANGATADFSHFAYMEIALNVFDIVKYYGSRKNK